MVTLEDGTIFTQSTYGIDSEAGKMYIRPTVLENMNSHAKAFCVSTNKPIIALIESKSYPKPTQPESFISNYSEDNQDLIANDRIIFKN